MAGLNEMFFSPLGKDYCIIFQVFMYITFLGLILTIVSFVGHLFSKNKNKNIMAHIISLFYSLLLYYTYRLLYSMCVQ